jgi:CRISPR/Cas system-associated endoribonuclease Cas2
MKENPKFKNYAEGKTRTRASLGLEKTRPFRFICPRGSARRQRSGYFGEIEPEIGLRFVELAKRIEDTLVFAPRSSRAGRSSHVIGRSSKRN